MAWEHERVGEDSLGQGKAEEGNPGRCCGVRLFNVFNVQMRTFDYRTCMTSRHSVAAVLLDLTCKRVLQFCVSPEPGRACAREVAEEQFLRTLKDAASVSCTQHKSLHSFTCPITTKVQ